MAAGVFGYLGYDMVRLMEDLPPPGPDPLGIPDAMLLRPTLIVVFDAVKDTITVVTPVRPQPGRPPSAALARAVERLSTARASTRLPSAAAEGRTRATPTRPVRSRSSRARTPRRTSSSGW